MAISKNRLEELIKENATIYCLGGGKHKLTEDDFVSRIEGEDALMSFDNLGFYENVDYLKNFFETEEQAEWALKYHKTRTEELNLPMWEDWHRVNKIGMYAMSFRDKKYAYCELMVFPDEIKVTRQAYGLEVLFDEPNTEENYEKACNVALKLFIGENNDK